MGVCCGKETESAFCPTCGDRLTTNEFIGRGEGSLRYDIDMFGYDLRGQADLLREKEQRYEKELKESRAGVQKMQEKMCRMQSALQHAREHGIA